MDPRTCHRSKAWLSLRTMIGRSVFTWGMAASAKMAGPLTQPDATARAAGAHGAGACPACQRRATQPSAARMRG